VKFYVIRERCVQVETDRRSDYEFNIFRLGFLDPIRRFLAAPTASSPYCQTYQPASI
jgi:hypothetical protein